MRKRVIEITNGAVVRDQIQGGYGYSWTDLDLLWKKFGKELVEVLP
jgi:hypothetical protein